MWRKRVQIPGGFGQKSVSVAEKSPNPGRIRTETRRCGEKESESGVNSDRNPAEWQKRVRIPGGFGQKSDVVVKKSPNPGWIRTEIGQCGGKESKSRADSDRNLAEWRKRVRIRDGFGQKSVSVAEKSPNPG
ncbi:hypothetical protein D3H55_22700 [Bacillus salacetis]|uniref:Uncharacterized protein n=1 Tax=Bacillus salacetis TaxID=2315464 RepID=A0A3A1QMV8_9BACI|nr:hypothetical protein [Bacillus salacetis]RIW27654.1 hypothetical protein D3H55_22700 [Bacillus salacetis]